MIPERKHIRLTNYDYSSKGWYFATICTMDRVCYFGKIENKILYPSVIAKQAEIFWNEIPKHFPDIEIGNFVIMPNHIHGIIGIVGTRHGVSLPEIQQNQFGKTIPGSLSAIIGQFKSTLTRWCNMNKYPFGWQGRFYDHIIRNESEFERIKNYIDNNISNWDKDKFYLM